MPTPVESAHLILKLYEQRREETLRKARDFMVTFDPKSFDEVVSGYMGPNSAYIRMVLSYWEMAASLVVNGAIDEKMFNDANGEHFLVFSRYQPYLPQLREMFQNPNFLKNLEQVCLSGPNALEKLDSIRTRIRQMLAKRAAAAAASIE
jgi:hypothetical protein